MIVFFMFSQNNSIYTPTFISLTLTVNYTYNKNVAKQSSDSRVGKYSVNLSRESNTEIGYLNFSFSFIKLKDPRKN